MNFIVAIQGEGLEGAPRETIVHLLSKSRQGRGKASTLTRTPHEGKYYAVIDQYTTLLTFTGVLGQLCIKHERVERLPEGLQIVMATPSSGATPTSTSVPTADGSSLLDDPRVREAAVQAALRVLRPSSLFGTTPKA